MFPLSRVAARVRRMARPAALGNLRSTRPLSENWGFDRGTPVDRYYIEAFLRTNARHIRGHVLEVKDSRYTDKFGSGVERRSVLDIDPANPSATVVADLAAADSIPSHTFDCFILTQTLHLIYNFHAALRHSHRILRPNGTLLATVPSLSRVVHGAGLQHDFWRLTAAAALRAFGESFGRQNVEVQSHGNVLTGVAFLTGMACEELSPAELDEHDPYFPLIVTVKATKA